jgi:hypothetical protein
MLAARTAAANQGHAGFNGSAEFIWLNPLLLHQRRPMAIRSATVVTRSSEYFTSK